MKNADSPAMPIKINERFDNCQNGEVTVKECDEYFGGLTKREHFAAMAMQGLLANGSFHYLEVPGIAIRVADLQLEELVR